MKHHTKEKGDLGNLIVISELARQGLDVLIPLSEHLPFDLMAYDSETNIIYRVQSKYTSLGRGNFFSINLRSCYSTAKARIIKRYALNSFDVLAIYLSDIDKVVFLKETDLQHLKSSVNIGLLQGRGNQRFYESYLKFPRQREKEKL